MPDASHGDVPPGGSVRRRCEITSTCRIGDDVPYPRGPVIPSVQACGARLYAVCAVVVQELDRAGRLRDDRHEMALATLARWTRGEDEPGELHDAMELMVQATFADAEVSAATRCVLWSMRLHVQDEGRRLAITERVLTDAVTALVALGEDRAAAEARVRETYDGAA